MSSKDYFDRVAQDWDEMRENFFSDEVRMKALSIAAIQKGKIAADIGAGTGFISEGLIREGLQVIAVDQSETILKEMKRNLRPLRRLTIALDKPKTCPFPMKRLTMLLPTCVSTMLNPHQKQSKKWSES